MSKRIANAVNISLQAMKSDQQVDPGMTQVLDDLHNLRFALDRAAIVAVTDRTGKIIEVNQTFCELSQYSREELIGRDHRVINSGYHPQAFFQQLWQTIGQGIVWKGEVCNRAKDGSLYWVDTTIVPFLDRNGQPEQYLAIRFDITNRKQSEENLRLAMQELQQAQLQLVQTEKLSSIGQLVAGIAHEINNPVNFIYGNLVHIDNYMRELLNVVALYQQHCPSVPEIADELDELDFDFLVADLPNLQASMKMGADRIRQIVLSLRNFSRQDEAEIKDVDLHEGLNNTLILLSHRLKAKSERPAIRIQKHYSNLPAVECYASQLNQVFMNLLGNAIDAIEMRYEALPAAERQDYVGAIAIDTNLSADQQVIMRITDNGGGIPETVQHSIFNPFFTTKAIGKGTGLGLSISHQIVTEKHGGRLSCESKPGAGTCFTIAIPLSQSASASAA